VSACRLSFSKARAFDDEEGIVDVVADDCGAGMDEPVDVVPLEFDIEAKDV
jgi:hypothetical protein